MSSNMKSVMRNGVPDWNKDCCDSGTLHELGTNNVRITVGVGAVHNRSPNNNNTRVLN